MRFVDFATGLAQNVALLLALTLLYSFVRRSWSRAPARLRSILAGVVFGLIAIAGMHTPFVIAPGVLSDARVIPVLLAGPFGGAGAAVTAATLAALYRGALGGIGGVAGVGTILTAGVLGVLAALRWHGRERDMHPATFLVLGCALDAILLAWAAALPDRTTAVAVVAAAAVPVGIFVPLGTLGLGMLLVNESRRHDEQERLALTQFALDRAADALFWIDATGRIVNANRAAERLTQYTRAELLERHVWDLEVDAESGRWREFWTEVREGGSRLSQSHYRRRDGIAVPVEASNDYVAHSGREWVSVFVRDVTERRRLEEERARQQLMKDQFLATLSHELRTPLTSILGYARLLRGPSLAGPAAARALGVIERNAVAQVRIVNDLLDLSGIVLGTFVLDRARADVAALVREEIDAARADAEAAGLGLSYTLRAIALPADVDATRLRQAVRQLLGNAVKFTKPGGRVEVILERQGSEATLMVRDTGIGIAPALLPQLFERFRQGDPSLTRSYGGLGVGLALARHIVDAHGGAISAHSDGPGTGATFTLRVPLAEVGAVADRPPAPRAARRAPTEWRRSAS
jgi:PAS domain S-box-containing protein